MFENIKKHIPSSSGLYILGLIVVSTMTTITSAMFWYLAHRNAVKDTLNGNILRLNEALKTLRKIKRDAIWVSLPRWLREAIEEIEDAIGNTAAKAQGFRELAQIRESFESEIAREEKEGA